MGVTVQVKLRIDLPTGTELGKLVQKFFKTKYKMCSNCQAQFQLASQTYGFGFPLASVCKVSTIVDRGDLSFD